MIFAVAATVFFWIGGILTTAAPALLDKSWSKPAPGLKDFATLAKNGDAEAATILEGRAIYVREGCWYCHTQQTRTIEADTIRSGWRGEKSPVSTPDEFVYDQPHMFGTRRTGPDLSRVGGKYDGQWHAAHFRDPREPRSRLRHAALPLDRQRSAGARGPHRLHPVARPGQGLAPRRRLRAVR